MKEVYTRRVVFTAMRPFLDDADLLAAMTIWQDKYARQTTYAFTQFLSESCRSTEIRRNRPSILSAIFKTLESSDQSLLPDPLNVETNQFDALVESQVAYAEANHVFVQFIENMLSHLGEDLALKVTAYLMKHLNTKLKLDIKQTLALKAWMHKKTGSLNATFDNKQKRELINILYIAISEYIGPVKADQLLASALKETELLAKTQAVDLHDYL